MTARLASPSAGGRVTRTRRTPSRYGPTRSAEALDAELVAAVRDGGVVGLMTIAPMGAGTDEARYAFGGLRELRDRLQDAAGVALPELSMGMSADAEAAAAEGATLVRIGTALFGPRP